MKLKALRHYSNKMMTVKPGQVFDVDEEMGQYLTKTFPDWFERVEKVKEGQKEVKEGEKRAEKKEEKGKVEKKEEKKEKGKGEKKEK